jgi:hypothetical protein
MDQIAASPDKPAIYTGVAWQSVYVLANVEIKWDSLTDSGTLLSSTPRSDAIFLEMPGKVHTWVHSPDEVVRLLRKND